SRVREARDGAKRVPESHRGLRPATPTCPAEAERIDRRRRRKLNARSLSEGGPATPKLNGLFLSEGGSFREIAQRLQAVALRKHRVPDRNERSGFGKQQK